MTSWKESDPEPVMPPKKPKKTSVGSTAPAKSGWQGQVDRRSKVGGVGSGRKWLDEELPDQPLSATSIRRWAKVGGLSAALLLLTVFLIHQLFFKQPKLPLYTMSVGNYPSLPELRENPFGNLQRSRASEINSNYVMPHHWELNGNDNALSQFQYADWEESLPRPLAMTKLGNSITAFYISCVAGVTQDSIQLFHQASRPFDPMDSQTVDLQKLLENIAASVKGKKNHYAWVILDLQLANSAASFGWKQTAWRTAVEATLSRMPSEQVERLIVTLPAEDGQNNWLAPEYSASFFGYHLFRLLDSPNEEMGLWDRVRGRALTLDEFRNGLSRAVSNDVANRRYAVQRPVWLPDDVLDRVKSLGLVGGSQGSYRGRPVTDVESRLRQLRELWRRLQQEGYRDGFRWDPLGFAKIESQLVLLEQIALTQPDSFNSAREQAERGFGNLYRPISEYQVSLVEDSLRLNYLYPPRQANLRNSQERLDSLLQRAAFPFSVNPSSAATVESLDTELASLSDREKHQLVWRSFRNQAWADRSAWDSAFNLNRLEEAFKFLGTDAGSVADGPLEIYLLKRLKDDIDWSKTGNRRLLSEACAKLVQTFELLQSVAGRPEAELSSWLRQKLDDIEPQFLLGFDWLIAGDSSTAIEKLDSATNRLKQLDQDAKQLSSVLDAAQQIFRLTPYLMNWLTKEYQFADGPEEIERQIADLGHTTGLSWSFLQKLGVGNFELQSLTPQELTLPNRYKEAIRSFSSYVEEKTDANPAAAARGSSLTFRRNQIALSCPMLSEDQRERLHSNIVDYLKNSSNAEFGAAEKSLAEERRSDRALSIFVDSVQQVAGQTAWPSIFSIDIPFGISELFSESPPPRLNDSEQSASWLLGPELMIRASASSLAMVPSLTSIATDTQRWQLTAATDRWKLAEIQRLAWQTQRLAHAGWGQGAITDQSRWSDFAFGILAGRYLSRAPNMDMPELGQLRQRLIDQAATDLGQKADLLKSIGIRFGEERQTIADRAEISAPIVIRSQPWNAVASVFMGSPGRPLPWNKSQPADRVWAAPLDSSRDANQVYKKFSTEHWQSGNPTGWMVVRGNTLRQPIDWRRADARYVELRFERSAVDGAVIRAESTGQPPLLNVVILMDCSDSMDLKVPALTEGATEGSEIRLLDQVKENLNRVLLELHEAHRHREADIRVCMIPFGVAHHSQLEPVLQGMLNERRTTAEPSDSGDWGHFYSTKDFRPLDDGWLRDLSRLVANLRSQADTPLYDAIREAVGQLRAQKRGNDTPVSAQILVFSDGVHYVNSRSPYRNRSNSQQVKSDIESINARLSIFHYDHFERWVLSQPERFRSEWRRVQDQGIRELRELENTSNLIEYVNSTDASMMVRKALESIPRTGIIVESQRQPAGGSLPVESTRSGYLVRIPQDLLPGSFQVSSTGTRGGAQQWVDLVGGESIELLLDSNSTKEFTFPNFEPDDNRSGWIPVGERQLSGSGFVSDAWYKPASYSPLSYIWMFRQRDPKKFTTRPALVVGMVSTNDTSPTENFLLTDYDFEPNTHYPRLRFAEVPWKNASANIRLWISDKIPSDIKRISLQPDQDGKEDLNFGQIRWRRNGNQVRVEVQNSGKASENRAIILFPHAKSTKRRFFLESGDEQHEADFSERISGDLLEFQWTTLEQLRSWASSGQITEIVLDRVPTRSR